MTSRLIVFAAVAIAMVAAVGARGAPAPLTTYSVIETASFATAGQRIEIYRDGDRAMMDQAAPGAPHTRTYYDLTAGRSYTVNLDNPLAPCSASTTAGAWPDPFAGAAPTQTGDIGQVNGVATRTVIADTPQGRAKLSIDAKSGLLMKWETLPKDGPPRVMLEVSRFSTDPPPARLLAVPAACTRTSTENEKLHLSASPAGVISATAPPASSQSCTALVRVVRLGSMTPLTSGYQIAIDRSAAEAGNTGYRVGMDAKGRADFAGGGLHEETASLKAGVLRITEMPRRLHVELCFGKAGCSSAQIYRHCAAPESILVFAVHNTARIADGGEWYWIAAPQ